MLKYHRSAGHPSNYNLNRILRDAGRPAWQVKAALDLHCDECAASKLGGISSGRIPPASMRPLPKAWESVGMDCTEWTPGKSLTKCTILVCMDLATKFKATRIILECGLTKQKTEQAEQILESFSQLWLQDKPKPVYLIPDNAKSMTLAKMREVMSEMNIMLDPPAPKESWANGLVERAVQEVKDVATKIVLANPDLSPAVALATNALNSTSTSKATRHFNGSMAASRDWMTRTLQPFPLIPQRPLWVTSLLFFNDDKLQKRSPEKLRLTAQQVAQLQGASTSSDLCSYGLSEDLEKIR